MNLERRLAFQERAALLDNVYAITFDAHFENLLQGALGVVAMGGYNTFCEILSFGKPALIVPRTVPRQEQFLRATRAAGLGLVHVLADDGARSPRLMAQKLRDLPACAPPDAANVEGLLGGLERIAELSAPWLAPGEPERDEPRLSRFA
jgi:predicted glycosyltransferase